MWLVKNPQDYDILFSLNLFGDIFSDLAAQLVEYLSFVTGGNIEDIYVVLEPINGVTLSYVVQVIKEKNKNL